MSDRRMRQRFVYLVAVALAGIFLFPFLANEWTLRSSLPNSLKTLVTLLNPPDDLYAPLVNGSFESFATEVRENFSFKHKYPGTYVLSVYPVESIEGLAGEIGCQSSIGSFAEELFPAFLMRRRQEVGFVFLKYEVPNVVALDERVICNIVFRFQHHPEEVKQIRFVVSRLSSL